MHETKPVARRQGMLAGVYMASAMLVVVCFGLHFVDSRQEDAYRDLRQPGVTYGNTVVAAQAVQLELRLLAARAEVPEISGLDSWKTMEAVMAEAPRRRDLLLEQGQARRRAIQWVNYAALIFMMGSGFLLFRPARGQPAEERNRRFGQAVLSQVFPASLVLVSLCFVARLVESRWKDEARDLTPAYVMADRSGSFAESIRAELQAKLRAVQVPEISDLESWVMLDGTMEYLAAQDELLWRQRRTWFWVLAGLQLATLVAVIASGALWARARGTRVA